MSQRPLITWDPVANPFDTLTPGSHHGTLVEVDFDLFDPAVMVHYDEIVLHAWKRRDIYVWDPTAVYVTPTRHPAHMMRVCRTAGGYPPDGDVPFAPITDDRTTRFRDFAENQIHAVVVRSQVELDAALPALRATPSVCRAVVIDLHGSETLHFKPTDFGYWACKKCLLARDPDDTTPLGVDVYCNCGSVAQVVVHRWIDWFILRRPRSLRRYEAIARHNGVPTYDRPELAR